MYTTLYNIYPVLAGLCRSDMQSRIQLHLIRLEADPNIVEKNPGRWSDDGVQYTIQITGKTKTVFGDTMTGLVTKSELWMHYSDIELQISHQNVKLNV